MAEPRAVPLGTIPGVYLRQVAAVLRPALVVGDAQRMWVIVTIARVVAFGTW